MSLYNPKFFKRNCLTNKSHHTKLSKFLFDKRPRSLYLKLTMKKDKLRNSLAVRLDDLEYKKFMGNTGKKYSETLRELIKVYNANSLPSDKNLKVVKRIPTVLRRL